MLLYPQGVWRACAARLLGINIIKNDVWASAVGIDGAVLRRIDKNSHDAAKIMRAQGKPEASG